MIAFERRASSILFGVLCARTDRRPILLPGNVCQIVPRTYEAAGHEFDLVDISAKTLSMDENECLDRIKTKKFAGVHFVRAYGSERSPESFFAELRSIQPDILIIDDKCLCLPDCDGESLSALADVTLFSTRYAKFVDIGTGGFAYLVDELPYHRAARGPEW
jgi:dTDP-4-amino-4,6-dideoxygalactose transaminase